MVSPPESEAGSAAGAAEAPLQTQSARILRVIEVRKAPSPRYESKLIAIYVNATVMRGNLSQNECVEEKNNH